MAGFDKTGLELKQNANGCVCVLLSKAVREKQQHARLCEIGLEVIVFKRDNTTTTSKPRQKASEDNRFVVVIIPTAKTTTSVPLWLAGTSHSNVD